jgi:hypothetical protein
MSDDNTKCKHCPNSPTELILTPTGRHYGKIICSTCKKYIKHARTPKTTEELEKRRSQILDLLTGYTVDRNDMAFLFDIYHKVSLTWGDTSRFAGIMKQTDIV